MSKNFPLAPKIGSSSSVESNFNTIKHRVFGNFELPIRTDEFLETLILSNEGQARLVQNSQLELNQSNKDNNYAIRSVGKIENKIETLSKNQDDLVTNKTDNGVNSGVMLMNLTRMRAFQWSEYVVPIYRKYKLKITWGDQDIINIIFHYHPGKLYLYSCRYNFRPDHCMYMSVCKSAEKFGVAVVHGSRGFFHSEKQPVFQAIYRAFEEFRLGGDTFKEFYQPLEVYLKETENTNCGHIKDVFLKNVQRFIDMENM